MTIARCTISSAILLAVLACDIERATVLESPEEPCVLLPAASIAPADVLFVVDSSASMAEEQANLAANFNRFINSLGPNGDYRIAVVTTDHAAGAPARQAEGDVSIQYGSSYPFGIAGIDTTGCSEGSIEQGCFRGPEEEARVITSAMSAAAQLASFADNVQVGTCGSGTEQGLAAMINTLERSVGAGCNSGFLREEALLVVVFVADEDDNSPDAIGAYVDAIGRFKPFDQIRVATIVGSVEGVASRCNALDGGACGSICADMPDLGSQLSCASSADCQGNEVCAADRGVCTSDEFSFWTDETCHSCSFFAAEDCCSAQPGQRYIDFALEVESRIAGTDARIAANNCRASSDTQVGCLVDSICSSDFGPTLDKITTELVIPTSFELQPRTSRPEAVTVFIRGGRFADEPLELVNGVDFRVSADGATLQLLSSQRAQLGEQFAVFFAEANCETPQDAAN